MSPMWGEACALGRAAPLSAERKPREETPMPATKDQWNAFREELSQQLEDERRFIANAEAGKTGIWTVQPGKGKVDTTAAHVEISRRAVLALEGVIAKIDQDLLAE